MERLSFHRTQSTNAMRQETGSDMCRCIAFRRARSCADFRTEKRVEFTEFDSFIQRFEKVLPSEPLESLKQIMLNVVPRAAWEAAEVEIGRMRSLLQESEIISELAQIQQEIRALKMDFKSMAKADKSKETIDATKTMQGNHENHQLFTEKDIVDTHVSSKLTAKENFEVQPFAQGQPLIERERAWKAVNDMLPLHISRSIIEGRSLLPVSRECVSVFFSDIVGFTAISSAMSACKVSDLLHRLISRLDNLALEYGVQKVQFAAKCIERTPLSNVRPPRRANDKKGSVV